MAATPKKKGLFREDMALIEKVVIFLFAFLLLLVAGLLIVQIGLLIRNDVRNVPSSDEKTAEEFVLDRAEDAVDSAQLILGFLEGAGFLVVLALGAAAIYGLQITNEGRDKTEAKIQELEKLRQDLAALQTTIAGEKQTFQQDFTELQQRVNTELDKFRNLGTELQSYRQEFKDLEVDVSQKAAEALSKAENFLHKVPDLFRAYQELELRNYKQAFDAICRFLESVPDDPWALYIRGWLELQYIPDSLTDGVRHLETALRAEPDNLSIIAAYGVGLRRQAKQASDELESRELYREAEARLIHALRANKNLLDPNRESFWGPIGGLLRDQKRVAESIEAYEKALEATPHSSYPSGNLAALYLQQAALDDHKYDKALDQFQATSRYAELELKFAPNDYYPMMDLAMSHAVLIHRDKEHLKESNKALQDALRLANSSEMLKVSLRGIQHLIDYCPPDWDAVQKQLIKIREAIEFEIAKEG